MNIKQFKSFPKENSLITCILDIIYMVSKQLDEKVKSKSIVQLF
jgi:hypothetical protein